MSDWEIERQGSTRGERADQWAPADVTIGVDAVNDSPKDNTRVRLTLMALTWPNLGRSEIGVELDYTDARALIAQLNWAVPDDYAGSTAEARAMADADDAIRVLAREGDRGMGLVQGCDMTDPAHAAIHADMTARAAEAYDVDAMIAARDGESPEVLAEEMAAAHESHGGAAGSFYAEGCSLCPPDDPKGYGDGLDKWADRVAPTVLVIVEGGIARTLTDGEVDVYTLDWDEVNEGPLSYIEQKITMVNGLPDGIVPDKAAMLASLRQKAANHPDATDGAA